MINSLKGWFFILGLLCLGQSVVLAESKPDWVDGASMRFPKDLYLTAVGFGDNRESAENNAYAAMGRIFRTEIQSVTHEAERFSQREGNGKIAQTDRTVNLQNQTAVSTRVTLEHVQLLAHWVDPVSKVHFALAAIEREKAARSLRRKILESNSERESWTQRSKAAKTPLLGIRALYRAVNASRKVDEYQSHLFVIDPENAGLEESSGKTSILNSELKTLLHQHFQVELVLTGAHSEEVKMAILEGLNRAGLTSGPNAKLMINGVVRFEKTGPKSPTWHFVRWNARIILVDKESEQIFGTIRRTGREGQLTPEAAEEKALTVLLKEVEGKIGDLLYQYIFEE